MKKILVLTDFSEASGNAFQFARSFFGDTVAEFHLLCVYPVETDSFYSSRHIEQTAATAFGEQLSHFVAELRREVTTDWHTFRSSARPGNLLDIVRQYNNADQYDYIVLGARKDGTNELFGNSATSLIRHIDANVLVVPVDAQARSIRRVVLATDFANLKNCKLLCPIKEFVALKGATLTLLTIDTPGKKVIQIERETRIRQFLSPIEPTVARLQASSARLGIEGYLAGHPADLLVTIPRHKGWTDALTGNSVTRSLAFTPPVPLLTLYDDGTSDQPRLIDDMSNLDYAL
ncbi:universal stress protein [Spirosoma utsteinense]|uniref:Nucleotide-binding universal stress UspA family protein n=1 Tax=Spirosoma utsteinense TaxID=2585773 RepID=A0ABR6WB86_9BACT|nr:universal stress protein [Spirosoma utsteinense]MBC3787599.1 nucleotide-binding universal stress UspA family protein [Spirosoma utsteinense]MBC3793195.1 nucleotide-binding universal stress UspA family protein [Spirosoma utsteinense]